MDEILENQHIRIVFDPTQGIHLSEIVNKKTGKNYLSDTQVCGNGNLFKVKLRTDELAWERFGSRTDFQIKDVERKSIQAGIQQLDLKGRSDKAQLGVNLRIELSPDSKAVVLTLTVRNESAGQINGRIIFPQIDGIMIGKPENMIGVLPAESGGIKPLRYDKISTGLHHPEDPANCHLLNAMEFADIYDRSLQEGLFVMGPGGGLEQYHFMLGQGKVFADQPFILDAGDKLILPPLILGVHTGDWHTVADCYRLHTTKKQLFPEIPIWFKEAGAIYGFSGGGGGAIYLVFPEKTLYERIGNFRNLPQLLDEAKELGTNIIYIYDYWEGTGMKNRFPHWNQDSYFSREDIGGVRAFKEGIPLIYSPYWNKGDYLPREDMGGGEAFKEGIARMHEQGGKIIVYLEPFITSKYSKIGQEYGADWAMMKKNKSYYRHYSDNWSMCPNHRPWIKHLVNVATYMVADYGVDGIYLDSYGMQWNWICYNPKHDHPCTAKAYNQGVLELTDRIREAIQKVKPEAVIMTESFNELLAQHTHGSLDGTFVWHVDLNNGRLIASPVRYTLPWINVFTNGRTLTQLKEVFAAGLDLALCPDWLKYKDYVKSLVTIRRKYKDALIYGRPEFQPKTGNPDVITYFFRGKQNRVITAVNIGQSDFEDKIELQFEQENTIWKDELTGDVFKTEKSTDHIVLHLPLARSQLRILIHQ